MGPSQRLGERGSTFILEEGLQDGLDARFGGRDRKIEAYRNAVRAITARLLADLFASTNDLAPKLNEIQLCHAHKWNVSGKELSPPQEQAFCSTQPILLAI